MRLASIFSLALVTIVSAAACGKDSSGGGATEAVTLDKLGLQADLPKGATVGDGILGDGVLIQGADLVVSVEEASNTRPATVEAAKEEADMYSPKSLETESLADGWALTFENTGSMGTNYFVQVRRDIGGKTYWCDTTASRPAQKTNALAVCKSLR
jgi:hypothetical protein